MLFSVAGVAIMVCGVTAATRWARQNWPINNNPVSEVYKLLWRILEPMLFTLSGYFLQVSCLSIIYLYLFKHYQNIKCSQRPTLAIHYF